MNPYPARIEELHTFLERRYGHKDRQATEILLAALLDPSITGARRPWLILETDYPSYDMSDGWFALGGECPCRSISIIRVQKAAHSVEELAGAWVAERRTGRPGVFIDPAWRDLPTAGTGAYMLGHTYSLNVLIALCVRLRVAHPKGEYAIRLEQEKDRAELARLTRRVLDNAHRPKIPTYDRAVPNSFLYWCEMLQRVNPYLTDWESLTGNLAAIARGLSVLYADGRPPDWTTTDRLMRDCINTVTTWIIEQAAAGPRSGLKAWDMFRQSGEGRYQSFISEVKRLNKDRVLAARMPAQRVKTKDPTKFKPWKYKVLGQDWKQLIDRSKRLMV